MIKIRRVIHTKRLLSLVLCLVLLVSVFPYGTLATTTEEGQPAEENQTEASNLEDQTVLAANDESEEESEEQEETPEEPVVAAEGGLPVEVTIRFVNDKNGRRVAGCGVIISYEGERFNGSAKAEQEITINSADEGIITIYGVPSGFAKPSPGVIGFRVDKNGNIQVSLGNASANNENHTIDVEIPVVDVYYVKIKLVDKNDHTKVIDQGELHLYDSNSEEVGTGCCFSEICPIWKTEDLKPGVYTLKQTQVPGGYVASKDVVLTIAAPSIAGDAPVITVKNAVLDDDGVVLVENDTTKIKVNKFDAEGKPLEGADLILYGPYKDEEEAKAKSALKIYEEDLKIRGWQSDSEDGELFDGILIVDKYYIVKEDSAPKGYKKSDDIIFKVEPTGIVQEINVVNELDLTKTRVWLRKQDSITGELLKGAKIDILNSEGSLIKTWDTTTDNPLFLFGELEAGEEYTLKETTTPPNYVVPTNVYKFTVKDPGSDDVQILNNDADPTKTRVQVWKRDLYSGAAIGGADLQILNADDRSEVVGWTSEDGVSHMIIGELSPGKTYILHELNAPAGYTSMGDVTFTMRADGEIQTVTMYNYQGTSTMKLTKTVTGTKGDRTYNFPFTFNFSMPGVKNPGPFNYTITRVGNKTESGQITNGGTLKLKHGDKVEIYGLPAGMTYTIKEWENDYYKVTVRDEYDGEYDVEDSTIEGKVRPGQVNEVNFTNNKGPIPAAGEENHMGLGLGMMLLGILGCCVLVGAYVLNEKKRML